MRTPLYLLAVATSLSLAACGGGGYGKSSSGTSSKPSGSTGSEATVKASSNARLGRTVLVDGRGMTLYHLSGETGHKFICTASCLSVWHPVTVSAKAAPKGVGSLSVVRRPEGAEQVAFKGMPLYTFAQDRAAGDVNGQGIKDVGTWMAATVSGTSNGGSGGSSAPYSSSGSSGSGAAAGY
jgi:predicted lipoprotein with Yx(FWY)xxD motif